VRDTKIRNAEAEYILFSEISVKQAICGLREMIWRKGVRVEVNHWEHLEDRQTSRSAKVIESHMVLRNKYKLDGTIERKKARLVARGFAQRPRIYFHQMFAFVAKLSSTIGLLIALAIWYGMRIHQFDIIIAYLNGKFEEKIYIEFPFFILKVLKVLIEKEKKKRRIATEQQSLHQVMLRDLENNDNVCLLRKSFYGLCQAGRN